MNPELPRLEERALAGLHDFLMASVLPRFMTPGIRAIDLGGGSGSLGAKLWRMGIHVTAVERHTEGFKAEIPLVAMDLNLPDIATALGPGLFDLVLAVEVIEHLESPVGFLRNIRRLLKPNGLAIVTTPNVENPLARFGFLFGGRVRMMDERGDPAHISPIFLDLLKRKYLPSAGLTLVERYAYPAKGYISTPRLLSCAARFAANLLRGDGQSGDIHILVLRPQTRTTSECGMDADPGTAQGTHPYPPQT